MSQQQIYIHRPNSGDREIEQELLAHRPLAGAQHVLSRPHKKEDKSLWKPGWPSVLRILGTYLALPFVTGVMAGMGEIFANELMYRWGWRGARPLQVPNRRNRSL